MICSFTIVYASDEAYNSVYSKASDIVLNKYQGAVTISAVNDNSRITITITEGSSQRIVVLDYDQSEGKVIAIDNYLNLVLENENGLETIKGGNVIFISLKED